MSVSRTHEPVARPPLVLLQQNASELSETVGAILERTEDALPVFDCESQHRGLPVKRTVEQPCGRLVDELGQRTDEVRAYPDAGKHHRHDRTSVRIPVEA